jgi:uncharacterized membrane protein YbaN (DUF454 family)
MRSIWFFFGVISVIIGVVGIFLPLLPTVPLLILAAFCFARSSEKSHNWLITHPKLGPPIADWNNNGAIRPAAKRAATLCVAASLTITIAIGVPIGAIAIQFLTLAAVMVFIWTRPSA